MLLLISILFSIFSTTVLAYISMATPIGPWIAPTLVLLSLILLRFKNFNIIYAVTAGSPGGILATAIGFTFPTLYFLDKNIFNSWLFRPMFFCSFIFSISLICGLIAFYFANLVEDQFMQLKFPVAELTYNMIISTNSLKQTKQLISGAISTIIFSVITKLDLVPLCLSIGYVSYNFIAAPLFCGIITKYFFINYINQIFNLSNIEFMLAFCSGLVLFGTVTSFLKLFKFSNISDSTKIFSRFFLKLPFNGSIQFFFKKSLTTNGPFVVSDCKAIVSRDEFWKRSSMVWKRIYCIFLLPLLIITLIFLYYFNFSLISEIYLVVFSLVAAYQVALISAEIGLAQLGRFATLIMIPAMLIFKLDYIQITILTLFVELCAGIFTDLLSGRKLAYLANVDLNKIRKLQLLGIFVSSITAPIIFFLLIKNLHLGSDLLFAQRAQLRALLLNFRNFNFYVLLIGFVYGYFLDKIKINGMLVLGGLLMPLNIVIYLLMGALVKYLWILKPRFFVELRRAQVQDGNLNYDLEPFFSGVFATQSIWILLRILI